MLIDVKSNKFQEMAVEYNYNDDANFLFLDSTLVSCLKTSSRNAMCYFSPRRWRKDVKPLQISALRNLKMQPHEKGVEIIARQISQLAGVITNGRPYDFVTNVPGGTSRRTWNFAALIAFFVARELNVPYRPLFEGGSTARCRSSHPKQSECFRPKYSGSDGNGAFGLLVDDVATSGVHFEKCVDLLKKNGKSAVCISWIS